MSWQSAIRLNATIASFLLSNEATAKSISRRNRNRYLKAGGGKLKTREEISQIAKEHMTRLRIHHGNAAEWAGDTPEKRSQTKAYLAELRKRRGGG